MTLFHRAIWRAQLHDALIYWIIIPAAVLVAGQTLDWLLYLPRLPRSGWLNAAAGFCLVTGLLLIAWSIRDLEVYGQGTPNPRRPPRKLVTAGSYRLCRHPMFLGYDLAALGAVLFSGSSGALCFSLPLFFLLQVRFLQQEERLLTRRFKTAYEEYRQQVPFLVPLPFRKR